MFNRLKLAIKVAINPQLVITRVPKQIKILNDLGHLNSIQQKKPVDKDSKPIPWFTYPAIEYLRELDFTGCTILEFGCGNSTLFFAGRCKKIHSIEHNEDWYVQVKNELPVNAQLHLVKKEDYANYPKDLNLKFDIAIIDGIERFDSLKVANQLVKDDGLIIFDNSDRHPEYCEYLRNRDYLQVDFHGFGPINLYTWTTSVFYRRKSNPRPITNQPLLSIGGGF